MGPSDVFPNPQHPNSENIPRSVATITDSYLYGESFTVTGESLGSTISYINNIGPQLYAHTEANGGTIGAACATLARWTDTIRIAGLEDAPSWYYQDIFLDLRFQLVGTVNQGSGESTVDFYADLGGKNFDPPQTSAGGTYSVSFKEFELSLAAYGEIFKTGVTLDITINSGTLAHQGESTSATIALPPERFYFALTDQYGNVIPNGPYPFWIESTLVPGRIYPMRPHPGFSYGGDYNGDYFIDGADYVPWRKDNGRTVPPGTGADGNSDGRVDQTDFDIWRQNFGRNDQAGIGTSFGVPEPDAIILLFSGVFVFVGRRRKFR
jgi:hypothetical protein